LPIVLRMFAEGKSEILADTAMKMQVSSLIESLSQEQIFDFARRLEPAQQLSFLDLYKQLRASKGGGIGDKIDAKEMKEKAAAEAASAAAAASQPQAQEKKE
jgi:hypothetical protein